MFSSGPFRISMRGNWPPSATRWRRPTKPNPPCLLGQVQDRSQGALAPLLCASIYCNFIQLGGGKPRIMKLGAWAKFAIGIGARALIPPAHLIGGYAPGRHSEGPLDTRQIRLLEDELRYKGKRSLGE